MNKRGQALPYFLVMMLILVMCWAMMVNIAKLTKDRIMMQNAADNAAISAAVYKARVYNTLGFMNYVMATLLYGDSYEHAPFGYMWTGYDKIITLNAATYPMPVPIPIFPMGGLEPWKLQPSSLAPDSQKQVIPVWDALLPGDVQYYLLVGSMKLLQASRKTIMDAYPAEMRALVELIGLRQEKNSAGGYAGADLVKFSNWDQAGDLGLIANTNGTVIYRAVRGGLALQLIKLGFDALLVYFAGGAVTVNDIYTKGDATTLYGSWVYAQTNRFDKAQRIVVEAYKFPFIGSDKGYPFFGDFLGLTWPTMHTIAAAGLYNTEGAMFPRDEEGRRDNISVVIKRYKDGSDDSGWDAHLIPVNQNGILH